MVLINQSVSNLNIHKHIPHTSASSHQCSGKVHFLVLLRNITLNLNNGGNHKSIGYYSYLEIMAGTHLPAFILQRHGTCQNHTSL
jgi:hypothetical protein